MYNPVLTEPPKKTPLFLPDEDSTHPVNIAGRGFTAGVEHERTNTIKFLETYIGNKNPEYPEWAYVNIAVWSFEQIDDLIRGFIVALKDKEHVSKDEMS